jgi:hypothetical protein
MSTHYNDVSHESRQKAAELHDLAAHTHRSAEEQPATQDHLTGPEHSRQSLEHSGVSHAGIASFGHEEIAARAHEIWEANGRPEGSADADWFRAAEELRARAVQIS